jgi:hypothetical protein
MSNVTRVTEWMNKQTKPNQTKLMLLSQHLLHKKNNGYHRNRATKQPTKQARNGKTKLLI